jgi:hypothetical protein
MMPNIPVIMSFTKIEVMIPLGGILGRSDKDNIRSRKMADRKIEHHWHAVLTLVDMLAVGFIITRVICLKAMKLQSI